MVFADVVAGLALPLWVLFGIVIRIGLKWFRRMLAEMGAVPFADEDGDYERWQDQGGM